jgi:hypothetical protein
MRQVVASLPKSAALGISAKAVAANSPAPDFKISQNYRQISTGGFSLSAPDNWQAGNDSQSGQLLILPDGGPVEGGGIGAGILVGTHQPKNAKTLQDAHQELLQALSDQNQGQMKADGSPQSQKVGGQNGLVSRMTSPSPYKNDTEHDYVVSVPYQNQLLYFIFIGPESRWSQLGPVYGKVIQSVKFSAK